MAPDGDRLRAHRAGGAGAAAARRPRRRAWRPARQRRADPGARGGPDGRPAAADRRGRAARSPPRSPGILVATAPIFTFLLAFALEGEERASRPQPGRGGDRHRRRGAAARASTPAAARRARGRADGGAGQPSATASAPGTSSGACTTSSRWRWSARPPPPSRVLMAPFAAISAAFARCPSLAATGSLLALGLLCTGAGLRDLLLAGRRATGRRRPRWSATSRPASASSTGSRCSTRASPSPRSRG